MRLESIFNNVDCKNKELNRNLFFKNKKISHSYLAGLFPNKDKNISLLKNENNTAVSSISKDQNNNLLNIFTLKNNLKFNNLNNKNNLLLQKKHRMDFKLQRSFDTDLIAKHNKSSNMQSGLNLLNNKIRINIKKTNK